MEGRYTSATVDDGLVKLMAALLRFHQGERGPISWLVHRAGTKTETLGP